MVLFYLFPAHLKKKYENGSLSGNPFLSSYNNFYFGKNDNFHFALMASLMIMVSIHNACLTNRYIQINKYFMKLMLLFDFHLAILQLLLSSSFYKNSKDNYFLMAFSRSLD